MDGRGGFSVIKRTWHVDMPLYYLGDKPFCSPQCATKGPRDEIQT